MVVVEVVALILVFWLPDVFVVIIVVVLVVYSVLVVVAAFVDV